MDNLDTISNDIACSEYRTGNRDSSYVSSAVCLNVNGGQQDSGQHGEVLIRDTPPERCYQNATRMLLRSKTGMRAFVACFRAVCLARSCEFDTAVVLIFPDIYRYRVIYIWII